MEAKPTLGSLLDARLRDGFIGRSAELALLAELARRALVAPQLALVCGAAGVGKTTLVRRFALDAEASGERVCFVAPGAAVESHVPATFEGLGAGERAGILVFDGPGASSFEPYLRALDVAAARLGPRLLVVMCARMRCAPRVRAELAFQDATTEIVVAPFRREETAAFLARRGAPSGALADELQALTGGHPLALALLAERQRADPARPPSWTASPDLLSALLREFLADAPSPVHQELLRLAALAEPLDEALAAEVLRRPLREEFIWLLQSPLAELGADGVGLVDGARTLLRRELFHGSAEPSPLITAATHALALRLARQPQRARAIAARILDMRRDLPLLRDGALAHAVATSRIARATVPLAFDRVAAELGEATAALFSACQSSDPDCVLELCDERGGDARVGLFTTAAHVPASTRQALATRLGGLDDDGAATTGYVRLEAPPQRVLTFVALAGVAGLFPALRRIAVVTSHFEDWEAFTRAGVELQRGPSDALALIGGAPSAPPGPPGISAALRLVFAAVGLELEVGAGGMPRTNKSPEPTSSSWQLAAQSAAAVARAPNPRARPDSAAFGAALRAALHSYHRSHALRDSDLLDCALLDDARGADRGVELRAFLKSAIDEMAREPGYADEAQVLALTFVERTDKQEVAAARLGLPFGTYRHRLRAALKTFYTRLWQRELDVRAGLGEAVVR